MLNIIFPTFAAVVLGFALGELPVFQSVAFTIFDLDWVIGFGILIGLPAMAAFALRN